ncbi:MAG: hypothetical protein AB1325_10615 [Nitrospirota bacterium]
MFNKKAVSIVIVLLVVCFLGGCVTVDSLTKKDDEFFRPAKTVADYERAGQWWGKRHWDLKFDAEKATKEILDERFVEALIDENNLDYFWVHADLKDAFVKGYRLGYQDRTADLVLGPHLNKAAATIGNVTGKRFVKVIQDFEEGWAKTLKRAIDVFITLIAEGSQKDRENFIARFVDEYSAKYHKTQKMLKEGALMTQVSEGGTLLVLDYSKGKTLGALDIPDPKILKKEIYHQTFTVMGDELGRRFSTNLIKRPDLVDLLRRSKTAFDEVEPKLAGNMGFVEAAFINSYGADAENVFRGLIKDAGYTVTPAKVSLPSAPPTVSVEEKEEKIIPKSELQHRGKMKKK